MEIKVPFLKEPLGAGDVVKAATSAVGIQPCTPCEERRRRMNAALRFTPVTSVAKNPWMDIVYPAVPDGWVETENYASRTMQLRRYSGPGGQIIIWRIWEGRYHSSYNFCCGPGMAERADQRWKELCR